MVDVSWSFLVAVGATFFIAGIAKGVTGMGLPTLAMSILGSLLTPVTAASLLIIPSLVTNVWQSLSGPGLKEIFGRLWTLLVGVVAGTFVSATLVADQISSATTQLLGFAIAFYALVSAIGKSYFVNPKYEFWLAPSVGFTTGLISGVTGVFVIPAVPYLQALGLEKNRLVQALGVSFTVSTVALAFGLASRGAFQIREILVSTCALVPSLVGMMVGQYVRRSISPVIFKRCFLGALFFLGLEMMLRGFI